MPPMGRGRGRGSRARKAVAVEPREFKKPQMQSNEKPCYAEEKIPIAVIYSSLMTKNPQPNLRALNLTVNKETKLTVMIVMKTHNPRPRPTLTRHRKAQKPRNTCKYSGSNKERRDYKKAMKNDPQIEKDLVEFYKTNPYLWDLRQEDHQNKDLKKKLLEDFIVHSVGTRRNFLNVPGSSLLSPTMS